MADLPQQLWPGIRAKLRSENQLPALLFFDLLSFCGIGMGGALRVTAEPDKLPKLASNTRLVKALCVAAAQLAGGAWHIEWIAPLEHAHAEVIPTRVLPPRRLALPPPPSERSCPTAEAVAHAS